VVIAAVCCQRLARSSLCACSMRFAKQEESDGSACRYIALMENRVTCGKRIIMEGGHRVERSYGNANLP
jgi:hypothetical protein